MKKIGMVGDKLIHTYAYAMHINNFNLETAKSAETIPPWQLELMEENPECKPVNHKAVITAVWGADNTAAKELAGVFDMKVCGSPEEVFAECDLVMVMDEKFDSRLTLTRAALEAGKDVFVDKIPSLKSLDVKELFDLASSKNLTLAAWSQMGFAQEYSVLHDAPQGGVAMLSLRLNKSMIKEYSPHLVFSALATFPGKILNSRCILDNDEQVLWFVENEHGTKLILGIGEMYPPLVTINYNIAGKTIALQTTDICSAFRRSAEAVVGTCDGKQFTFSNAGILEAGTLIEKICNV
jgi:Oxidoreductase family, NAD-binding Rossmann fold